MAETVEMVAVYGCVTSAGDALPGENFIVPKAEARALFASGKAVPAGAAAEAAPKKPAGKAGEGGA